MPMPATTSWLPFLYPPPASVYVAAMSAVSIVSMANAGLAELRGDNMAYSKFWHVVAAAGGAGRGGDTDTKQRREPGGVLLRSRDGMLVAYAPALLAAAASFAVPGAVEGARAELLAAHFLKRVLEVLLVHRYSGSMPLGTAATIGCSYLLSTATMIYAQHLSRGLPDPAVDLLYPGVLVFAVGLAGNFYHHHLLSRLRAAGDDDDKKVYKIPTGGLFGLVTCPHYLFEILAFFGFAMIAQTLYALAVATGTAAYLAGRSCATRRWYQSKFDEFPARIKALLPYVL